jgi:hypothetical protein
MFGLKHARGVSESYNEDDDMDGAVNETVNDAPSSEQDHWL